MHAEKGFDTFWRTRKDSAEFRKKLQTFARADVSSAYAYFGPTGGDYHGAIDMIGASFPAKADLSGKEFSFCNLEGAQFTGCQLNRTNFDGVYLGAATFRNCDAVAASFRGSCLIGADFYNSDMAEASFNGAILKDAIFRNARNLSLEMFVSEFSGMKARGHKGLGASVVAGKVGCYGVLMRVFFRFLFGRFSVIRIFEPSWADRKGIMDESFGDFRAAIGFYGELRHALRSEGQYDEADHVEYMRQRASLFWRDKRKWAWGVPSWMGSVVSWTLTGFGRSITRLTAWAIIWIVASAIYYTENPFFTIIIDKQRTCLEFFEALYFSSVTFATLGYGDIAPSLGLSRAACEDGRSFCDLALIWPVVEALGGAVFIALFVVVVFRRMIKE